MPRFLRTLPLLAVLLAALSAAAPAQAAPYEMTIADDRILFHG